MIDMSVVLFGLVFPVVAFKHRLQMLEHFSECIRQAKATRQEAVQINIFTALLNALKVSFKICVYSLVNLLFFKLIEYDIVRMLTVKMPILVILSKFIISIIHGLEFHSELLIITR